MSATQNFEKTDDLVEYIQTELEPHLEEYIEAGKKKSKIKKIVLISIIAICIVAAVISGYMLLSKYLNDANSKQEYDAIRQSAIIIDEKEEETIQDAQDEVLILNPELPFDVDFDSLHSINKEIVAWIYIPCLDLSYPVAQTDNNSFYLNHTVEKTPLDAGAIFVDSDNTPDFTDPNTLVYGHNMKNKAMFGKLWHILYEDYAKDNQDVWIYTSEHIYKYKIFSTFGALPTSDVYALFGSRNNTFLEWCHKMQNYSEVSFEQHEFVNSDCVLTLSTCGTSSSTRTLVLCYLDKEIKRKVLVDADKLIEQETEIIDETTVREDLVY